MLSPAMCRGNPPLARAWASRATASKIGTGSLRAVRDIVQDLLAVEGFDMAAHDDCWFPQ